MPFIEFKPCAFIYGLIDKMCQSVSYQRSIRHHSSLAYTSIDEDYNVGFQNSALYRAT